MTKLLLLLVLLRHSEDRWRWSDCRIPTHHERRRIVSLLQSTQLKCRIRINLLLVKLLLLLLLVPIATVVLLLDWYSMLIPLSRLFKLDLFLDLVLSDDFFQELLQLLLLLWINGLSLYQLFYLDHDV